MYVVGCGVGIYRFSFIISHIYTHTQVQQLIQISSHSYIYVASSTQSLHCMHAPEHATNSTTLKQCACIIQLQQQHCDYTKK